MYMRSPADMDRWADPSKRGNCLCRATDPKCQEILRQKGLEGIVYDHFEPLFEPVAEISVPIQHMTQFRKNYGPAGDPDQIEGNFEQADFETALRWTAQRKDGRAWTALDVRKYRETRKFTWHERWDGHTMDLVPTCIHDHFRHDGFVAIRNDQDVICEQWEQSDECAEDMDSWGPDADSNYDPETGEILEPASDPEPAPDPDPAGGNGGFCSLQLMITGGLLLCLAVTCLLSDCTGFLQTLLWLVSSVAPYAVLLALCFKCKGLPKRLRSRTGGILLLAVLVALHLLVPLLAEALFVACAAVAGYFFLNLASALGPDGTITLIRENADGSTTTETHAYYGSSAEAVSRAESDLRAEGYSDIRRTY